MLAEDFSIDLKEKLSQTQRLTYWLSFEQVMKLPKKGRNFQKLKPLSKFRPDHELALIQLYLQKIYLISIAQQLNTILETSVSFFQSKEGLIFGIYNFYHPDKNTIKYKGVEMKEEDSPYLKNIIEGCIGEMCRKFFDECGQTYSQNSQITISLNNLLAIQNQLYLKQAKCQQFIEHLEKQPISQHYIYKIKLRNGMLGNIFYSSSQKMLMYESLKKQKVELLEKIQIEGEQNLNKDHIRRYHQIIESLIESIYKQNRIGWLDGHNIKTEKGYNYNFVIILSQYRNNLEEKKEKIQNQSINEDSKNKKSQKTKIQIKACNGMIQPRSGNAIFVHINWYMGWQKGRPWFMVKIQTYNNHKVQELYFTEILQFWSKLQAREDFHQLTSLNKFSIQHNPETLEVVFSNMIQRFEMPEILKELDRTVAILLSLDEIVEICERKGSEEQEENRFQIKPYLFDKTIVRLKDSFEYLQNSK